MNMTVFLLKKLILILNFSFFFCSNLGLFTQTCGLSTENNNPLYLLIIISNNFFFLQKCKHAHILFT